MAAQRHERNRDYAAARVECEAALLADGGFVPAHLRLSRYAQAEGRYNDARRHALQAADAVRSADGAPQLAYVTLRLLDFSEDVEVSSLILSADWASLHVLQQSPSLAQHLWLAGRYGDTLRFLDAVEARLPPHPLLRLTRGNVLRYLGRLDDATACYEQSLSLDPRLEDAHWALATISAAKPSPAWLHALQAACARDGTSAQLAYAAFHALDRAGDTAAAWGALERGMRIMRAQVRYDAEREASRLGALMSSSWLPEKRTRPAPVQPRPVFIVGLPRTGTTLLDRIFGNHGWVTSVGERNDFAAAASEVGDVFFTTLADVEPATWSDRDAEEIGRRYRERLRILAPATAVAVDKNPRNLFNLPLILKALPEAKVLIMQRDPMDAAFSNLKELFQGGAYPYSYDLLDVASHVEAARHWSHFWAEAAPDSVRLVSYETLVQRPETHTEELCDFLSLPRRPGLSEILTNESPVATASSAQIREPVHTRRIGAWERYAAQLAPLRARLDAAR